MGNLVSCKQTKIIGPLGSIETEIGAFVSGCYVNYSYFVNKKQICSGRIVLDDHGYVGCSKLKEHRNNLTDLKVSFYNYTIRKELLGDDEESFLIR